MFRIVFETGVLLAGHGGFFVAVGTVLGGPTGTLIGLVGLVMVGRSFWFSDRLAVRAAHARPIAAGGLVLRGEDWFDDDHGRRCGNDTPIDERRRPRRRRESLLGDVLDF